MTVHYSVESLKLIFLSDQYIEEKTKYLSSNTIDIESLRVFLNSIEINKQYFRTGIQVKNPKYKKKVSDDTMIIKNLKSSLNKMTSLNYTHLCDTIIKDIGNKKHLYPILLQYIFEQALTHHNYCNYYSTLVDRLHNKFNDTTLLHTQIETSYNSITSQNINTESTYSNLCSKNKQIDQLIGYSIFISELEVKQVITNHIHRSINSIIDNMKKELQEDELYKCVICLSNIFNVLYTDKPIDEIYINHLTEIKDSVKFMKIKFKLMDILEGY